MRKTIKYSASDPRSFEEVWSFQSNMIRLVSLIVLVIVSTSVLAVYLFSGTMNGTKSISRSKLEKQSAKIVELTEKIDAQENYLRYVGLILSGEVPVTTNSDSVELLAQETLDKFNTKLTASERRLNAEVKDDLSTRVDQNDRPLTFFAAPVKGTIDQKYSAGSHAGIHVLTTKDNTVSACLAGTIVYTGYTRSDGYIVIIEHAGGFLSVYKNNKTVLKKIGGKVQRGDPIAIVGDSGGNIDGSHLHFELWYQQSPVDPENYISFKR
ncbi:MAG: M23 family metallopeptidase [Crocinitomicaceae bacterium]|nr:M23 family metallopeptidase [Crocinitomicaceae bacterium]